MKAEITGRRLLIYPESRTEQVAGEAFCAMYKDGKETPKVIMLPNLIKTLPEMENDPRSNQTV